MCVYNIVRTLTGIDHKLSKSHEHSFLVPLWFRTSICIGAYVFKLTNCVRSLDDTVQFFGSISDEVVATQLA
jgi:hypothetical protein